jgi:hypothetical protein
MRNVDIVHHLKNALPPFRNGEKDLGDIRWNPGSANTKPHWLVRVGMHNMCHHDARAKGAANNGWRLIPWMFGEDIFSTLFVQHLKQRDWKIKQSQISMHLQNATKDRNYLFLYRFAKPI